LRIGIDLMGSDSDPHLLFNAVLHAAACLDNSYSLLVIATKSVVDQLSSQIKASPQPAKQAPISFREVADTISMSDDPLGAIRRKKESSLVVGMRLLKKRQLNAFVSCGNTGALIASAVLSLPVLPGISRPALLATLPTEKGPITVLDVGSAVACKAHNLVQYAHLGAAYQRAIRGVETPTIGLLNVGVESKKGTTEVRQAYEILKQQQEAVEAKGGPLDMRFVGNVEGRDVFKGGVDVLVTDGFTGNIFLKTAEGVADFIFEALEKTLKPEAVSHLKGTLEELKRHFNYVEYPGAMVCGVDGIVIKVHGNGSVKALYNSIIGAAHCVQKQVIPNIKKQLATQGAHVHPMAST